MGGDPPQFHPVEPHGAQVLGSPAERMVLKGEVRTDELFAVQHDALPYFPMPSASPRMKKRWAAKKVTTMGSAESVIAAKTTA